MQTTSPFGPGYADAIARKDPIAYMAALDELRMRKLGPQMAYCFKNEYYNAKMREAGITDPRDIRTIDEFRALPAFLTKALHRESQAQSLEKYGHPFGMHLCAPVEDVIHVAGTSGTTGLPTFYLFTRKDLELTYLTIGRVFEMIGLRRGDSILQLFGLSIWVAGTTMVQAAEAYGARPIPLGAEAGVTKALQYIEACRPRVLFATPSMVSHLIARAPEQLGRPLNTMGIEVILVGGEPGMAIPAYRRRLQEGTGAKVFDSSSGAWTNATVECGGPDHQGLHYMAEDYCFRYDLVDPETRKPLPLVDGQVGEAIHTGLEYEAAPALRYATGDILKLNVGECPHCGRFGSRFHFVGRADDLMNIAGVKVYPTAIKEVVETFSPDISGQMQIVLDRPLPSVTPPVRMTIEAASALPESSWDDLARKIEAKVHLLLKVRLKAQIVAAGSLATSNLKTKLVHVLPGQEAKA
ncbi:phenylacetate--CoA ligase family protein [Xenophilus azovorans]|uniref:phenylacetate--CoA ligase family protein n=1 Tax=Xenophilus azovorans TaxID=151755 RepID=UPI00056DCC6A|nr:AMP-binding protein [Xenophilus azovorans]